MSSQTKLLRLDPYEVVVGDNVRSQSNDEDTQRMAADLLDAGCQLQPVGVRRRGGKWHLVYGHRRLAALQWLAGSGKLPPDSSLRKVLAIEVPSREEDLILQIRENSARRNLKPVEEAEIISDLMDAGKSVEQIARIFGRSAAWVSQRRSLLSLPAEIRTLVGSRISPYDGYLLTLTTPSEQQARVRHLLGVQAKNGHGSLRRKRPSSRDAARVLAKVMRQSPSMRPILESLMLFLDGKLSKEEVERRLSGQCSG